MARYVFYSFHFQNDIFRANVVRNSWVVKKEQQDIVGWYDASLWEEAKKKGDASIKKLIDDGLTGASVTAVLIGAETHARRYVQYEISQSWMRKKGLIGIYLDNIPDLLGRKTPRSVNPFATMKLNGGLGEPLSQYVRTYDWVSDNGYANLASWVESAAQEAARR